MSVEIPAAEKRADYACPIDFKSDVSDVIVKHVHGAHLRASPDNHELVDHKGGYTDWSKWAIHVLEPGKKIRLQSMKTRKYLRLTKRGTEVTIDDYGSKYSEFLIHTSTLEPRTKATRRESKSPSPSPDEAVPVVELESVRFRGKFITVRPHEGVELTTSKSHRQNWLEVLARGKSPADEIFTLPYLFERENTVVIRHPHGGGVAIIESELSAMGTKASHSRWTAIPTQATAADATSSSGVTTVVQFRHNGSGQWLAVTEDGHCEVTDSETELTKFKVSVITSPNVVKLESLTIAGAFLSSREEGITVGKGGPHSQMTVLRMS